MKKCRVCFLLVFVSGLLVGCHTSRQITVDLTGNSNLEYTVYEEQEGVPGYIALEEYRVEIPQDSWCTDSCMYGDKIYYAISYSDHMLTQETGEHISFEEKYSTRIYAYDCGTGKEELLYCYDLPYCIDVHNMCCNGSGLFWTDTISRGEWRGDYLWRIFKLELQQEAESDRKAEPEVILDSDSAGSEQWDIIFTLAPEALYWREPVGKDRNTIYRYDLLTEEITREQEEFYRYSSYWSIEIAEQVMTICTLTEDGNSCIVIKNMDTGDEASLLVDGKATGPVSNGRLCVWSEDTYYRNLIYKYDMETEELERIQVPGIFSYEIIGDKLFINDADTIWCYEDGAKTALFAPDEKVSYFSTIAAGQSIYGNGSITLDPVLYIYRLTVTE
ncbi:MAG: hypothetical protein K2N01_01600 [Lachnospiraceae bacterium]|nr:hypothetical protein [Lachnospiraceae bacterium]